MGRKRKTRETVLKVSEGMLETVVDLSIYLVFWGFDIVYGTSPAAKGRAIFSDSDWKMEALEQINYKTLKKAINNARQNGWIKKVDQGGKIVAEITKVGRKRLEAKLPFYDADRVWEEVLHLVTYDIPEKERYKRAMLREKLLTLGCGMLQESVYITPYNPREVLYDFIRQSELKGAVIISSLGKDGSIGEENIMDLIYRVYGLGDLNKRYREFLVEYDNKDKDPISASFAYLSILKDDPQLPFDLLPDEWVGDVAYQLFRDYIKIYQRKRTITKKS